MPFPRFLRHDMPMMLMTVAVGFLSGYIAFALACLAAIVALPHLRAARQE